MPQTERRHLHDFFLKRAKPVVWTTASLAGLSLALSGMVYGRFHKADSSDDQVTRNGILRPSNLETSPELPTLTWTSAPKETETPEPTATFTPELASTIIAPAAALSTPIPEATPKPIPLSNVKLGEPKPGVQEVMLSPDEHNLMEQINQMRANHGLKFVSADSALMAVAREKTIDMARKNYLFHSDQEFEKRLYAICANPAMGKEYRWAGEDIGRNNYPPSITIAMVIKAWLDSPAHRNILLDPSFKTVGVGVVLTNGGMNYFSADFAKGSC